MVTEFRGWVVEAYGVAHGVLSMAVEVPVRLWLEENVSVVQEVGFEPTDP